MGPSLDQTPTSHMKGHLPTQYKIALFNCPQYNIINNDILYYYLYKNIVILIVWYCDQRINWKRHRAESFQVRCQWEQLEQANVQIITLLFPFTVQNSQKYIYPHVRFKLHACWVFPWFSNPTNSDMDHRIFNVCIVHQQQVTGQWSAQSFWLQTTKFLYPPVTSVSVTQSI